MALSHPTSFQVGPPPESLCLVTGGAGFIGSHLVAALVAGGRRVRVLDNLSTGRLERLAAVRDQVELVVGDVTDPAACRRACEGTEYVFHHAAKVSVADSVASPVEAHETNATGTLNLLMAAREAGCRRFIYAGSASAYGDTPELPHREEMPPCPRSPYAVSKHIGELYCQLFNQLYGLQTVVLRYFNVFGPGQEADSPYSGVIAQFIRRLLRGEPLVVYGDGDQTRDFVAVENVVRANLLACEAPEAAGKVFNIGSGESITVNHLARTLQQLVGVEARVVYARCRPGDLRHSLADISRARSALGYEVKVGLREGLRRTIEWYRQAAGDRGD